MASLITTVDKTSGNYEDAFIYSLNASFNGIEGDILDAKIKVFFPDYLNVFLGDIKDPVKSYDEVEVSGGKEIAFNFGAITDLGISVRLGLGVSFKLAALNGESFILAPELFINDEDYLQTFSDEIVLTINPRFEISRNIVLPSIEPSMGSEVYYKVTLKNFGDVGAILENAKIICSGNDNVTIDETFIIKGKDVSTKFADKTLDGAIGTVVSNEVIFDLSTYRGEIYEFIYKAKISDAVLVGEEIETLASFFINDVLEQEETHDITVNDEVYDASISIYVPDFTIPQDFICYKMNIENTGNKILLNAIFENELPEEIKFYEFSTGSFNVGALDEDIDTEYEIFYQTLNGESGTFGIFNTNTNSVITLSDFISDDDRLSEIRWELLGIGIGTRSKASPSLLGVVNADTEISASILSHIHLTFLDDEGGTNERVQNASTTVENVCVLRPLLVSSVSQNPIRPNEEFRYEVSANLINSRLKDPIVAIFLPKEILYLGNETFEFSDIFEDINPILPTPKVFENFTENGETLVKYQFDNEFSYDFNQLASFKISFDAKVSVGAYGLVSSFAVLNTATSVGRIPDTVDVYYDKLNIAENPDVDDKYAKTSEIKNRILFFVSTSSNKKVKGALDTEFLEEPNIGKTYEGGKVEYLISVKNIGNSDITNIEIVDILPYVGDTSVLSPEISRGSLENVYALSSVTAKVTETSEKVSIDVFYSESTDPLRVGPNFNTIGTVDDWNTNLPEDLTNLKAFKVKTKDFSLKPNEVLEIEVLATAPVGATVSNVSWNSFSADMTYLDLNDKEQHLLAIEPEKVGISIEEALPDTIEIGGFVFLDINKDGIFTKDEPFLNDMGVMLLDESDTIVAATFTTPDSKGNLGQYLFKNIPKGKYYIRFFIDNDNFKFAKLNRGIENGNSADSRGNTELFDMSETLSNRNVLAGLIPKEARTISEVLKVNRSARGMVRDVVKNQMLLVMKEEDVLDIIKNDL